MTTLLWTTSLLCVLLGALAWRQRRALALHRAAETQAQRAALAHGRQLADLPLVVCAWDERLVVRTWGLGAEAAFGIRPDEARGVALDALVAPADARAAFGDALRAVLAGECAPRLELASVARDGRRVVCEWFHEALRDADGAVVGGLSLARDVTQAAHVATLAALDGAVLGRLADDVPEAEVLGALVTALEAARPDLDVALLRVDSDGRTLRCVDAGRLDGDRRAALDGLAARDGAPRDARDVLDPARRAGRLDDDAVALRERVAMALSARGVPLCWTRAVVGDGGALLGALVALPSDGRAADALDDELLVHAARLAARAVLRRAWERERRAGERRLREAFRALPLRALVLDADGRILLADRAAAAAWGLLADDAAGRDLRTLLAEREEGDALLALADEARAGGVVARREEFVLTDAPGCRRVHALAAVPLVRGDPRAEVLLVLDDVTDARRAERARRERDERAHESERLAGLGVLAGGLAHELDGLVRAVHERVRELGARAAGDGALRDGLAALERDAERVADLVRLVLACGGRPSPAAERLDLDALVRDSAHLLEAAAPARARVEFEPSGALPPVVGDAEQLRRLLLALVENAVEALPRGEGTIVVRTSARRLLADDLAGLYLDRELREGTYVVLEVEDDGEGLDPAVARRAFDPFFTTKATGRGLGLSAVLGIVRGHGGAVQLDGEPGRGTCVRVLLPSAELQPRVGARVVAG